MFPRRNSGSLTEPYLNINNARFQVGSEVFHPGATECAQSVTAAWGPLNRQICLPSTLPWHRGRIAIKLPRCATFFPHVRSWRGDTLKRSGFHFHFTCKRAQVSQICERESVSAGPQTWEWSCWLAHVSARYSVYIQRLYCRAGGQEKMWWLYFLGIYRFGWVCWIS